MRPPLPPMPRCGKVPPKLPGPPSCSAHLAEALELPDLPEETVGNLTYVDLQRGERVLCTEPIRFMGNRAVDEEPLAKAVKVMSNEPSTFLGTDEKPLTKVVKASVFMPEDPCEQSAEIVVAEFEQEVRAQLESIATRLEALTVMTTKCMDGIGHLRGTHSCHPTTPTTESKSEWMHSNTATTTLQGRASEAEGRGLAMTTREGTTALSVDIDTHEGRSELLKHRFTRMPTSRLRHGCCYWPATLSWEFLEDPNSSRPAWWFAKLWPVVLVSSALSFLIQALGGDRWLPPDQMLVVNFAVDSLYCVDVSVRVLVAPNTLAFLRSPYDLLDVVAALPICLDVAMLCDPAERLNPYLVSGRDMTMLSVCYVFVPVIRLMKMLRLFPYTHLFMYVFHRTWRALVFALWLLFALVLLFSAAVYISDAANIGDMTDCIWYTVVTMTTVGYGDKVPTTHAGRAMAVLFMCTGMLGLGMPVGIIGNAFTEAWDSHDLILFKAKLLERMAQLGYSPYDLGPLIREFSNGRGDLLTFQAFRALIEHMKLRLNFLRDTNRTLQLFEAFDKDGSGLVDSMEFLRQISPQAFLHLQASKTSFSNDPRSLRSRRTRKSRFGEFLTKMIDPYI